MFEIIFHKFEITKDKYTINIDKENKIKNKSIILTIIYK